MKSMEYRIYVNGKLENICQNDFALACNLSNYRSKYGKENVEFKRVESIMDNEKKRWLYNLLEQDHVD